MDVQKEFSDVKRETQRLVQCSEDYLCTYIRMYIHAYVQYVCMYIHTYICMYSMYVRMYLCMVIPMVMVILVILSYQLCTVASNQESHGTFDFLVIGCVLQVMTLLM